MKKKIIAVILAAAIAFSMSIIPASANTDVSNKSEQTLYTFLDNLVNKLVGGIAAMIITPDWAKKSDYQTPDSFLPGMTEDEFIDEPAESAKWQVGYANTSLLTGKELSGEGDYYVGGSLSVTKKLATAQYDDQEVRVIAMSDGRGISIFAVLDAYGMANTDVRAIREAFLSQYEGDQEITAINISALHQHSCVDTFGMNGDIVSALFTSSFRTLFNLGLPSGQNEEYMKNLYAKTISSMNTAIENMESGKLYYGTVDVSDYIRDKRDPEVYDPNLNRFRFVPDNEEHKETWFVEGAIHCVGNGAGNTELTGDYPYYMEQYINKNYNANFIYIQGAELAISDNDKTPVTSEYNVRNYASKYNTDCVKDENGNITFGTEWTDGWKLETCEMRAYGEILAIKLNTINNETEVDPILNIAYKEVWIEIDNNILALAAKGGLLVNNVHKAGLFKYEIVSEVGYAEFGKDIAISIIPGELAPEIAFGGADKVQYNWNGESWDYESFQSLAGDKKLLVFGLSNDQVGYLLTNNNWHSFFTENEEIVSAGKYAGASVAEAYISLYKQYNK